MLTITYKYTIKKEVGDPKENITVSRNQYKPTCFKCSEWKLKRQGKERCFREKTDWAALLRDGALSRK